jgi:hypothetical protein
LEGLNPLEVYRLEAEKLYEFSLAGSMIRGFRSIFARSPEANRVTRLFWHRYGVQLSLARPPQEYLG